MNVATGYHDARDALELVMLRRRVRELEDELEERDRQAAEAISRARLDAALAVLMAGLEISPCEAALLLELLTCAGLARSHAALLEASRRCHLSDSTASAKVRVHKLRVALARHVPAVSIQSVYGFGYRITRPDMRALCEALGLAPW